MRPPLRRRYRLVLLLSLAFSLAVLGAIAGRRLVYPQIAASATPIPSPATQSYLIVFGIGAKQTVVWDGTITATGGTILNLQGWRFSGTDAIIGTTGWKASVRPAPAGPSETGTGLIQENGIIVTVAASATPVMFDVTTPRGNFSFSSNTVTFGTTASFITDQVQVTQTGSPLPLTSSIEDEDFPSMAQSGDDVYLAYTRYVHGDRTLAQGVNTKTTITDFSFLARATGGDQVLLMHYSKAQRVWTGPFSITAAGEDAMRTAVAVDGQGRAWVFYSVQRSGNFDIYARSSRADGTLSPETVSYTHLTLPTNREV